MQNRKTNQVRGFLLLFLSFLSVSSLALAQFAGNSPVSQDQQFAQQSQIGTGAPQAPALRPNYLLGPNDQILIRVPQEEQINERPFRIEADGFITLPVVGRIRAEGLTVQALETTLTASLKEFVRDPLVSISVVQFRSEPVFFVGAFRAPGVYPVQGGRTLVEMLAAVGGTLPNSSRRIKITRRAEYGPIPLSNAVADTEKKTSSVEISLQKLIQDINPEEDIVLKAYDVVSVDRSERIYVNGEVTKVGALELGERESISVAQALTEAGGFTPNAVRDKARVLRPVLGTNRRAEFEVDLKRIFEGKEIDFPLLPNDLLYIPRSGARSFLLPVAASVVGSTPYLIITALLR